MQMKASETARVVQLPGPRIKLDENEAIRQSLLAEVEAGRAKLVLDFAAVEFVDSSFLGFLIILLKRASSVGGDVRLCSLKPVLRSTFVLMRLDRLFGIHDTPLEAVRSFDP